MKKYENLEHTADLKIRAFGKTKEEVFANLALGMFENISEPKAILKDQPIEIEIKVKANELLELLVDFLNQLVYLSDVNNVVYNNFDLVIFSKDDHWIVEGVAKGYKVNSFKLEIKAATYNELKLEEDQAGNWVAEVVFDI